MKSSAWQVEVEVLPNLDDAVGKKVEANLPWLGIKEPLRIQSRRLFLLVGPLDRAGAEQIAERLLTDPVVERCAVHQHHDYSGRIGGSVAVFRKPGVMDPVEASVKRGSRRLGHELTQVRTGTAYLFEGTTDQALLKKIAEAFLANAAIEDIHTGDIRFPVVRTPAQRTFARVEVPLQDATDQALVDLSRRGCLALTLVEMQAIRDHFRTLHRNPTDVELESVAQTWSEHCKHKTLTGPIRFGGELIDNVLARTIKAATETIAHPMCLSVFHDNAGVIRFDDQDALCIKVETHNHPSAIEPYGGAGTGLGGVIRDVLGTGRGAKPVANLDVFCVGPLDLPADAVPKGALHPLRVLRGVVAGVRDYGNQMGIPTVTGAVYFDERYVGNPLVYCGTVGLLPQSAVTKEVKPGDLVVVIGGRTGRDGIHGATFSSVELHEESETVDSGAVQIGNAITEKKVADVVITARNRGLFRSITDCGAGGLSSAVGEMGETTGARVDLAHAPLKYEGLSPAEIWISEAQERMVLAVPANDVEALLELCRSEDVEAAVLGEFTGTGRLEVLHGGTVHADLDMNFLHRGLPRVVREAVWNAPTEETGSLDSPADFTADLLKILAAPNVASKEWIIRQYDHEVLAGSVIKPLVGTHHHGPSDAAVVAPKPGSTRGFALGVGMNPRFGDCDPYAMAEAAIDEAVRNVVAVGADPGQVAILDNFSWGNTSKPDRLGALVRCAQGCHDAAIALGVPFVSGKDSLNNEYQVGDRTIVIPHSLLVTALGIVPDVRQAVTMDLKEAGNRLFVLGETRAELGGSHLALVRGRRGVRVPRLDGSRARRIFRALHDAIARGLVRSCHDLSEGGLVTAAAEMVLAGEVGARIDLGRVPVNDASLGDLERAFSESLTRFVVEVAPEHVATFERTMRDLPCAIVGETTDDPRLHVIGGNGKARVKAEAGVLEACWRPPLTRRLEGGAVS